MTDLTAGERAVDEIIARRRQQRDAVEASRSNEVYNPARVLSSLVGQRPLNRAEYDRRMQRMDVAVSALLNMRNPDYQLPEQEPRWTPRQNLATSTILRSPTLASYYANPEIARLADGDQEHLSFMQQVGDVFRLGGAAIRVANSNGDFSNPRRRSEDIAALLNERSVRRALRAVSRGTYNARMRDFADRENQESALGANLSTEGAPLTRSIPGQVYSYSRVAHDRRPLTAAERAELTAYRHDQMMGLVASSNIGDDFGSWLLENLVPTGQALMEIPRGGASGVSHAYQALQDDWSKTFDATSPADLLTRANWLMFRTTLGAGSMVVEGGLGAITSPFAYAYQQESGGAFLEYTNSVGDDGRFIDPQIAGAYARDAGIINSVFELVNYTGIGKALGVGNALKAMTSAGMRSAFRRYSLAEGGRRMAMAWAGSAVSEGATEFMQEASVVGLAELARLANDGDLPADPMEQARIVYETLDANKGRLVEAGLQGMVLGGAIGLVGSTITIGSMIETARVAQQQEHLIKSLAEGAATSELRKQNPETYERIVNKLTGGTPIEQVAINVEDFIGAFNQDEIQARAAATELGVVDQFDDAAKFGGEIKIPMGAVQSVMAGTEQYNALAPKMRLGPNMPTPEEAEALLTTGIDVQRAVEVATKFVEARQELHSVRDQIAQEIRSKLEGAQWGATQYQEALADILSTGYVTMAKAAGMDVSKLPPLPDIIGPLGTKFAEERGAAGDVGFGATETVTGDQSARGGVRFEYDPVTGLLKEATLHLTNKADFSTPIHEIAGHYFLELLRFLASQAGATEQIKSDWNATLEWLGTTDSFWSAATAMSPKARRDALSPFHEKFAVASEVYFITGRAPSLRLRNVFRLFKTWMLMAYRKVWGKDKDMKARPSAVHMLFRGEALDQKMQGVFDRMFATQQEIAEAADEMGGNEFIMTREEFNPLKNKHADAAYQRYVNNIIAARREAEERIDAYAIQVWAAENTRNRRSAEKRAKATVEAEMAQDPVWFANDAILGRVELDGIGEVRLNSALTFESYPELAAQLPKGTFETDIEGLVEMALDARTVREPLRLAGRVRQLGLAHDADLEAVLGGKKGLTKDGRSIYEGIALLWEEGWFGERMSAADHLQGGVGRVTEGVDDGRSEQARDRGRRYSSGGLAPLTGAPNVRGATGPDPGIVAAAEAYASINGIRFVRQGRYAEVDVEFATRIAQAYEEMEHAPNDPAVREAYANLKRQTRAQYDALIVAGYTFDFFDAGTDPYKGNPSEAVRDLRANKHMSVYGTYDGYGTVGVTGADIEDNPMLEDTGLRWPDQSGVEHPVLANDLFRAVHDAFGHSLEGAGFRARGEENAWQAHIRLYTGTAIHAATSETRGQNSWLNFGPYSETNQTALLEDTKFARQKIGLMPSWTWEERVVEDAAVPVDDIPIVHYQTVVQPPFFSALEYIIVNDPTTRASGAQWWATISKAPGAKKEELEWLGLEDWLKAQEGQVSREDVLAFVRANGVTVEETVLGGESALTPEEQQANLAATEEFDRLSRAQINNSPAEIAAASQDAAIQEAYQAWLAAEQRYKAAFDGASDGELYEADGAVSNARGNLSAAVGVRRASLSATMQSFKRQVHSEKTRWSQYTLPGGENYRELLLRLPEYPEARGGLPEGWSIRRGRLENIADMPEAWITVDPNGKDWGSAANRDAVIFAARNEQLRREGKPETAFPQQFRSSHFDQPNILAHVRFNERVDAEGKRTLFIEELQSDWHQAGRERGYRGGADIQAIEAKLRDAGVSQQAIDNLKRQQNPPDPAWTPPAVIDQIRATLTPDELARFRAETGTAVVPDAPFKNNAWAGLALKRMIRWGAENGFDSVSWTRGDHQEQRYWPTLPESAAALREVLKPESVRQQAENYLGREMAAVAHFEVMNAAVLAASKHDEIFRAVVEAIPVDVVNILTSKGITPDEFARNPNVFSDVFTVDDRATVAMGLTTAQQLVGARLRAALERVLSPEATGRDGKLLSTIRASDLNPREVAGLLAPSLIYRVDGSLSDTGLGTARLGAETPMRASAKAGVGRELTTAELTEFLNRHGRIVSQRTGDVVKTFELSPGEGMRAFYDRILPNIANDLGKKYGARVGETAIDITPQAGRLEFSVVDPQGQPYDAFDTLEAARQVARDAGPGYRVLEGLETVHTLPITKDLREAAMNGMPLWGNSYVKRGPKSDLNDGRWFHQADIEAEFDVIRDDVVGRLTRDVGDALDVHSAWKLYRSLLAEHNANVAKSVSYAMGLGHFRVGERARAVAEAQATAQASYAEMLIVREAVSRRWGDDLVTGGSVRLLDPTDDSVIPTQEIADAIVARQRILSQFQAGAAVAGSSDSIRELNEEIAALGAKMRERGAQSAVWENTGIGALNRATDEQLLAWATESGDVKKVDHGDSVVYHFKTDPKLKGYNAHLTFEYDFSAEAWIGITYFGKSIEGGRTDNYKYDARTKVMAKQKPTKRQAETARKFFNRMALLTRVFIIQQKPTRVIFTGGSESHEKLYPTMLRSVEFNGYTARRYDIITAKVPIGAIASPLADALAAGVPESRIARGNGDTAYLSSEVSFSLLRPDIANHEPHYDVPPTAASDTQYISRVPTMPDSARRRAGTLLWFSEKTEDLRNVKTSEPIRDPSRSGSYAGRLGGIQFAPVDVPGIPLDAVALTSAAAISAKRRAVETIDSLEGWFFQGEQEPTREEFLEALREDVSGVSPRYRHADTDAAFRWEEAQKVRRFFERRGIDIKSKVSDLREQIALAAQQLDDRGVSADEIASVINVRFGQKVFSSGQQMLEAVIALPSRKEYIDQQVKKRVDDEMGDFGDDLPQIARVEMHNMREEERILAEMDAIKRASGSGSARAINFTAKQYAKDRVERMRVREAQNPEWALAHERRWARKAQDLFRAGKFEEADKAKFNQLVHFHLYREMVESAAVIERMLVKFKQLQKLSARTRLSPDYYEQIVGILADYELRDISQPEIERRISLADWVQRMKDEGREAEVQIDPAVIARANRTPFSQLTYTEAVAVRDAILNIEHLGLLKNRLLKDKKGRELMDAVADAVATINKAGKLNKKETRLYNPENHGIGHRNARRLREWHAALTKPEFLFRSIDGQWNGVLWNLLYRPFAGAADKKAELQARSAATLDQMWKRYTDAERSAMWSGKRSVPELIVDSEATGARDDFLKSELVAIALNLGNSGNVAAMVDGFGWFKAPEGLETDYGMAKRKIIAALDKHLTKKDWDFVQSMWDLIGSFRDEAFSLHERLTGLRPEAVNGEPVETKSGTLRGGYYPLKFDALRDTRVAKEQAKEDKQVSEWGPSSFAPMTKKGHLINRKGAGGRPVKLDLSVAETHINNVVHDIAYREALIDANKIITHSEFRSAFIRNIGEEMYNQLAPWLHAIAGDANLKPITTPLAKAALKLRGNMQVAIMGFKVATATQQLTGIMQAIPHLGALDLSKAIVRVITGSPELIFEKANWITSRSQFMKTRMITFNRDIRETLQRARADRSKTTAADLWVKENAFFLSGLMDWSVSSVVWTAAYEKALSGKIKGIEAANEEDAVAYADSMVRQTQSAGLPQDLPQVMRADEVGKLLTSFYSYFSVLYNWTAQDVVISTRRGRGNFYTALASFFLIYCIAPVLNEFLAGRWDKEDETEEERMQRMLFTVLRGFAAPIPMVRDVVSSVGSFYDYKFMPAESGISSIVQTGESVADLVVNGDEFTEGEQRKAAMALGVMFGLPLPQVYITGDYVRDYLEGDEEGFDFTEAMLRDTR